MGSGGEAALAGEYPGKGVVMEGNPLNLRGEDRPAQWDGPESTEPGNNAGNPANQATSACPPNTQRDGLTRNDSETPPNGTGNGRGSCSGDVLGTEPVIGDLKLDTDTEHGCCWSYAIHRFAGPRWITIAEFDDEDDAKVCLAALKKAGAP